MGWDLNKIMSQVVEILGDKFISYYTTPDSSSCVRINHTGEISVSAEEKIVGLFPDWIRVEFYTQGEDDPNIEYEKKGELWVVKE